MWANVKKVSLTKLSNSGGEGCRPVSVLKDEISSICCNATVLHKNDVNVNQPSKLSLYGSGKSAGGGIFPAIPFCPVFNVVNV